MKRSLFALLIVLLWVVAVFPAQFDNTVHFHHAHLNVVDPAASSQFYEQIFGAVPVKFGNRGDAVFTERSFLLFSKVASTPSSALNTGIWHLGWGGVDGPQEFNTLTGKGVQFQTPVTPLGNFHYMYAFGPDKELLEVWTGYQNHRYGHVHLISADPVRTVKWYADTLGIGLRTPTIAEPGPTSAGSNALQNVDNVNIIVFRQPATEPVPPLWAGNHAMTTFESTKGHAVDHIAFSFRTIDPIFARMKKAGVTIVDPISMKPEFGFKSFFIEGPDKVLIEIVEAKPIPEASWE
ncbi:MAG: VOC family protein [Acidobacteriaceae bacterium]|nr:VOC family protein [Acidobacteriaceae bacterium]